MFEKQSIDTGPVAKIDGESLEATSIEAKTTEPLVTGEPPDVTVEVKVTDWPNVEGLGVDVSAVVVGLTLVMVRHHPPLIEPVSPEASSTTQRLHVPLPLAPLNVESVVAPLTTGAGAGKEASAA